MLRPRVGDTNVGNATVTLPPKIFLAQENIETICTPKQFTAHNCPKGSEYGSATAITPLLDKPLTGPVYLRGNGSARALPDLVAALSGDGIEIDLLGKIDTRLGGLRARFDVVPDAPVTKFTMTLRGGEHGIIANATDTCAVPAGRDREVLRPGQRHRGLPDPPATDELRFEEEEATRQGG